MQPAVVLVRVTASVGADVPTFEEVRQKIEARQARAQGMAELTGSPVEAGMLEVEQAQMTAEAQSRLSELRTQLGLTAPASGAVSSPAGSSPCRRR